MESPPAFEVTIAMVSCGGIGLVLILRALYQRRWLRASQNWIAVTGKVTRAEVVAVEASESRDYELQVSYEYAAGGSTHVGRRIAFGRAGYARKKRAQEELACYPVGESVIVWVNPDAPDDAVLDRATPNATLYLVLGILLAGVAIVIGMYPRGAGN